MGAKHAKALLAKLETMLGLISKYWGRPPHGVIELYVVDDLRNWPPGSLNPIGAAKIAEQGGITLTETLTLGGQKVDARAVVYAVAHDGVAQHEAVHAYCGQSFGTAGPLWYAEGMAEMGNYWQPNDSSVHISPVVLNYVQHSEPQSLDEIIRINNAQNLVGDSWQNYAWRWALCHLLANNTNYSARFRPLGLGFLTEQRVSFEDTYGAMAREIEFEYLFFVRHIEDGYRVDLCSWDWKKRFKPLIDVAASVRVEARHGWQPTGVEVKAGRRYEYTASGAWQIEKDGPELTADGDDRGAGRLVAAIFDDFSLGEPFPLGVSGVLTAPASGQLHVRCDDAWGKLADNKGAVTLKLRVAKPDAAATSRSGASTAE